MLKSALEIEDHVLRVDHIVPIDVEPHQEQSTHESVPTLEGTPTYSHFEGDLTDKAQRLLQWHAENRHENIIFSDEKIFTIKEQYNHQNDKIHVQTYR